MTRIEKSDWPAASGVPESTPALVSVRPEGSAPVITANVNGAVPAVADSVYEYAEPTAPSAACRRDRDRGAVGGHDVLARALQPPASVAVIVNVSVPAAVIAPLSRPAGDSVRPGGSVPALTENVVPGAEGVEVIVWLYAAPVSVLGSDAGSTTIGVVEPLIEPAAPRFTASGAPPHAIATTSSSVTLRCRRSRAT